MCRKQDYGSGFLFIKLAVCTRVTGISLTQTQISKIFYTNSGTLLGIDESRSPVLLVKRDWRATPPRKLLDRASRYEYEEYNEEDEERSPFGDKGADHAEQCPSNQDWDLPKHLDPEWFAFEVWTEAPTDDQSVDDPDESELDADKDREQYTSNVVQDPLGQKFGDLGLSPLQGNSLLPQASLIMQSSLSLLQCLLRLASLQNYQQASHLSVHDELLNLFLSDANSWLGSRESREREREDAKRRIGFDPFESPPGEDISWTEGHQIVRNEIRAATPQPLVPGSRGVGTSHLATSHLTISKVKSVGSHSPRTQALLESSNEGK